MIHIHLNRCWDRFPAIKRNRVTAYPMEMIKKHDHPVMSPPVSTGDVKLH